jgi:hypothetical protein
VVMIRKRVEGRLRCFHPSVALVQRSARSVGCRGSRSACLSERNPMPFGLELGLWRQAYKSRASHSQQLLLDDVDGQTTSKELRCERRRMLKARNSKQKPAEP